MTTQSLAYTPGPQGEFAHRPIVWGTRGMVGGHPAHRSGWPAHPVARRNAVDAAVAAAFAAGVLEPSAHYSLGGEVAFLFYYRSSQQCGQKLARDGARGPRPGRLPGDVGIDSVGGFSAPLAPGVISALLTMLSHYGTMSFRQVVESALGFARYVFPADQLLHRTIGSPDWLMISPEYWGLGAGLSAQRQAPGTGQPVPRNRTWPVP